MFWVVGEIIGRRVEQWRGAWGRIKSTFSNSAHPRLGLRQKPRGIWGRVSYVKSIAMWESKQGTEIINIERIKASGGLDEDSGKRKVL